MHDLYLKLIREELSSKTLAKLTNTKLNEYRVFIHTMLASLVKSPESSVFVEKLVDHVKRDTELWARFRFAKLMLGAEHSSETVDASFLEMISSLIKAFVELMNGLNISYGSEILIRYSRDSSLPTRGFRKKGDYEFVKIDDFLYSLKDRVYDTIPYLTVKFLEKHVESRLSQR